MPTPRTNALVPVAVGELMYVSLMHVLDHVEEHGTYPPGMAIHMRKALRRYEKDRTNALLRAGFQATAVVRYTANAKKKMGEWINERSAKTPEAQADFSEWKKELASGDDVS